MLIFWQIVLHASFCDGHWREHVPTIAGVSYETEGASQVPLRTILTRQMTKEKRALAERARWALSTFPIVINDGAGRTVEQICAAARRQAASKEGLALLCIDYLKFISTAKSFDNVSLKYGHITAALKRLAKDISAPVLLLHQIGRRAENRADQLPTLADLEWSASVEQDADQVTFIHRPWVNSRKDEDVGKVKLIVAKNRGGETGMVPAFFVGETVTFRDLDDHERERASGW